MKAKNDLYEIIQSHLHRRGWDILYNLDISLEENPHLIDSYINRDSWVINHKIDPNVEAKLRCLTENKINIKNPLEKLLCGAADHEEGHWSVCPYDIDYAEDILYNVSAGLKVAGLSSDNINSYFPRVSNLFMDIITNFIKGLNKDDGIAFSEGRCLKYLNELSLPGGSQEFLYFVDMQMKAYGISQFKEMAEHCNDYDKDISLKLMETILPKALAEKPYHKELDSFDARLIVEELSNKKFWGKKAAAFAKAIAPYLSKPNGNECGFIEELLENPELKKELVRIAMSKHRQIGNGAIPYLNGNGSFEAAYEQEAERIVLNFFKESEEDELEMMDLFHMQKRLLEEGEQNTGKIDWGRAFFIDTINGRKPMLYKREIPYQIPEEVLPGRKSLEDMLFVLDVSGSMGWTRKAFDGSKYDLALRSVFGTINGLEHLGRAAHARFGLVLFSSKTEFSGWEDYYSMEKFKSLVFNGYQGGSTVLDNSIMQKALTENPNRFLAIIISDGEIQNDAAGIIKKYIAAGNDVVQFSIGKLNEFSMAIKRHGAAVIEIAKPSDLVGLVLEKAVGRYL